MAQRGRRGSSRSRASRGARGGRFQPRSAFRVSRLKDSEEATDESLQHVEDEPKLSEVDDESDVDDALGSDEDLPKANAYATLLGALRAGNGAHEPPKKRQKLDVSSETNRNGNGISRSTNGVASKDTSQLRSEQDQDPGQQDVAGSEEDVEDQEVEADQHDEPEDDEDVVDLRDPFEAHYASVEEKTLAEVIRDVDAKRWTTETAVLQDVVRKATTRTAAATAFVPKVKRLEPIGLKLRLKEKTVSLSKTVSKEDVDCGSEIFSYTDIICGIWSLQNAGRLREMASLHAINHILKTRDRVLKNNTKFSQLDSPDLELRDQGFTRPKVLILTPTRNHCLKYAESLASVFEPDQEENKTKFHDVFHQDDDEKFLQKPADFQELFGGNSTEEFRIGIKFTRKTMKYFSSFYNSDVILASPLGLQQAITTAGTGKDKKQRHDADFLSSIEIVVVDQANALLMQNWQHVDFIFSQLNQIPKESHGCDFSRVRNWYLDGKAKYLRQTIIFAQFLTPEINSLANSYMLNVAGRVKYTPTYRGAMLDISASLPITVTQSFLRFDSPTPSSDNDARFRYFTTTILPSLVRDKGNQRGVLLYVPTYLDFVRLRNHFSTSSDTTPLAFGLLSEYTEAKDMRRVRSHFESGRYSVLLYTERAHHYYRHRLRGTRKIIFYGVPENPVFWTEIIDLLGTNPDMLQNAGKGRGLVRAIFSKWDGMKLERIVGTERVGRLINEKGGDTFDFV